MELYLYKLMQAAWDNGIIAGGPYDLALGEAIAAENALYSMLEGEALEAAKRHTEAVEAASNLEGAELFELGFKLAFRLAAELAKPSESFTRGDFL